MGFDKCLLDSVFGPCFVFTLPGLVAKGRPDCAKGLADLLFLSGVPKRPTALPHCVDRTQESGGASLAAKLC
jgi:hypothetical protein